MLVEEIDMTTHDNNVLTYDNIIEAEYDQWKQQLELEQQEQENELLSDYTEEDECPT